MAGIRAVPVTWKGITFASTLEADWALNLDKRGIRWDYEPEAVKLPDGQNYRCDFYLRLVDTWLEVKGPHDQRMDKPGSLAMASLHAPGCETGDPDEVFGLPGASCPCGFGPRFPWRLVVIGRPNAAGLMAFEGPHWPGGRMHSDVRLMACPACGSQSFIDMGLPGARPVCRRCRTLQPEAMAWPSGGAGNRFVRLPARGKTGRTC